MNPTSPRKGIRGCIAAAQAKAQRRQRLVESRKGAPQPGDLFQSPVAAADVLWAVIQSDTEDNQRLFLVPADDHPLAGITDVAVPRDEVCGPLVLRCGSGVWFPADQLNTDSRVGALAERFVRDARKKLAQMIRGTLIGSSREREAETDPEYEYWTERVAAVRQQLVDWLMDRGMVERVAAAGESLPDCVGWNFPMVLASPLRRPALLRNTIGTAFRADASAVLAAASGGLLGRMCQISQDLCVAMTEQHIDEPLLRTNAVYCLQASVERSVPVDQLARMVEVLLKDRVFVPEAVRRQYLPAALAEEENSRPPRIVGLLFDATRRCGLVAPLIVELSAQWRVAPNLPFTAETLRILLQRVLESVEVDLGQLQPELFCFRLEDVLGRNAWGSSMTLAGLLAVLDAASGRNHVLLQAACVVVEPDGESLRPVEHVRDKLQAFHRECHRGTLLICHQDCHESTAFRSCFDEVWHVKSLGDLAESLERVRLLEPFRQRAPLDTHKLEIALERIRYLGDHQSRYGEALMLGERLRRHKLAADVSLHLKREMQYRINGLYRHLGSYEQAIRGARAVMTRELRASVDSSYDSQARSVAEYAAALFDPHRFEEMLQVLEPWFRMAVKDPLRISPGTRVAVFNTLGRAQVALRRDGWQANFKRSLAVLDAVNPHDRARTLNYQIHGLLRTGSLQRAATWIDRALQGPMSDASRRHLAFARAELARRRGKTWQDRDMDQQLLADGTAGHPFGFYFQATARQRGRNIEDAVHRFRCAEQFFQHDVGSGDPGNIQIFLAACMRLGEAAWLDDSFRWQHAVADLTAYVRRRNRKCLADYYQEVLPRPGSLPSVIAADALLQQVPYF